MVSTSRKATKLVKKYWPIAAIAIIMFSSFSVRLTDYRWPYLRNIDSYFFFRHMDEIIGNDGVLPPHDNFMLAPHGSERINGQFFYPYLGAYTYMAFFSHQTLTEFLIWFPAFIAALMAIPVYFIGKYLYDRKAGILAAFFIVFDVSIMSRSLAGDPDSDAIVLLMPLITIALFILAYKYVDRVRKLNIKTLTYFAFTGVALGIWAHTWAGQWYIFWLMTGFTAIMVIKHFLHSRRAKISSRRLLPYIYGYIMMIILFFAITLPFFGSNIVSQTIQGPLQIGNIKVEEGREFPNVLISVAELQSPGDIRAVVQRTSPIDFGQAPLAILISPFFLMIYALIYLVYSYITTRRHFETLIFLGIWFIGPFVATLSAVRFSILFVAPMVIGSAIIISKLWNTLHGEHFKE